MLNGLQQSCPRSLRSHIAAGVLAIPDAAMDGLDDEAYESFYSDMMFVADHERMTMAEQSMLESTSLTDEIDENDDIMAVMEADCSRYRGCAEAHERGVHCSVGRIPAAYADDQPRLNFVRRRDALRLRAEEHQDPTNQ